MAKAGVTREKLIIEAAKQFAAKGFEGVSVRDVTQAVSANVASISYHFGGSNGLIAAVLSRYFDSVFETRKHNLGQLKTSADLRTILREWIRPLVESAKKMRPSGQVYYQLACQSLEVRERQAPAFMAAFHADMQQMTQLLQTKLPGVSLSTIQWRWFCSVEVLLRGLGRRSLIKQSMGRVAAKLETEDLIERLLDFCEAGLSGQVTLTKPKPKPSFTMDGIGDLFSNER